MFRVGEEALFESIIEQLQVGDRCGLGLDWRPCRFSLCDRRGDLRDGGRRQSVGQRKERELGTSEREDGNAVKHAQLDDTSIGLFTQEQRAAHMLECIPVGFREG